MLLSGPLPNVRSAHVRGSVQTKARSFPDSASSRPLQQLTVADLKSYVSASWLTMGVLDHIPRDILDSYPALRVCACAVWGMRICADSILRLVGASVEGEKGARLLWWPVMVCTLL